MGKRTIPVRAYEKQDGTKVRHHKREIDDLGQYDPLSEEWNLKMNEKREDLKTEETLRDSLEKEIKRLESENKHEQAALLRKVTDEIDDPKEVLGTMSKKIDNKSVESIKKQREVTDTSKEIKHLNTEIKVAKKVAAKKKKHDLKETKKELKEIKKN